MPVPQLDDWPDTPLGAPATWSHALRTIAHVVLDAPLPMFLIWGPARILLYNSAFATLAGAHHPQAFGAPVAAAWPALWRWDDGVFETAYRGALMSFRDQHLFGTGTDAAHWFDMFYTPVRNDDGRVGGVLCNVVDTTGRVRAERTRDEQQLSVQQLTRTLATERSAATELAVRLREESDFLKSLFEQAPGFMALTRGPQHVFEFANASYLRMTGKRELLGRPVAEAFPEIVAQGFIELLDTCFNTGQPYVGKNVEILLQNQANAFARHRLLDFVYQPVRDSSGVVTGIFVEGVDVTERAAVEERLRIAHEAGGIGTFEWFPTTDALIASNTYRALWGFAADVDLHAAMLVALVEPEDRRLLGNATEENRSNPLAYAEFRIRRADTGEKRWLARRGEVLGDGITRLRRYVGVAFDITERKLVEEALASTERKVYENTEFIRLLLDSTEEGFYSVDRTGATTLCNRGFLRMLGFGDESEALGRRLHDLIHHSHADGSVYPREECPISLAAQTGEAAHVEHEFFFRTDGSRFPVEYRVHPIWRDGQLQGALCTFIDISQRVDNLDQLRILNDTLEHRVIEEIDRRARAEEALHQSQKMEAIGQLTGGVAHDFNNVLQIIGGNLQLLQSHVGADLVAGRRLEIATAAVARGAKLSSQLLAFARRQPLQPIVVNLGRLVQDMYDLLRRALGESIEIETTIADGLWNTLADPSQIENVILNLAINSRDAMDGAGRLTIAVGNALLDARSAGDAVAAGDYVLLEVSDTGAGMSPEILQKAFEPFFTTKAEGEGTGLGLSMAYGFVKQSHGHIRIDSEPEQGTTIRIYLPRSCEPEAPLQPTPSGPIAGGSETILVVEDDPGVQATVVDTLTTLGYEVLRANDGASALVTLKSGVPIDLLFTDVVMPGPLRSPELARQARLLLPNLAVLFTSGYTQDAIVHGGRLDPGVDLLSKPYRRDQLARKIRNSLASAPRTASTNPVAVPQVVTVTRVAIPPAPQPASQATVEPIPDAERSMPPATAPAAIAPADDPLPLRILVVEDNPDLCQLVCELLDSFGHATTAAGSAETALKCIAAADFDVLLTDVRLPGMSGIDLARSLIAQKRGIEVIFASGYGAAVTANVGFPAHSLAKPYDIDQLHALLESFRR